MSLNKAALKTILSVAWNLLRSMITSGLVTMVTAWTPVSVCVWAGVENHFQTSVTLVFLTNRFWMTPSLHHLHLQTTPTSLNKTNKNNLAGDSTMQWAMTSLPLDGAQVSLQLRELGPILRVVLPAAQHHFVHVVRTTLRTCHPVT